MNLLDQAIREHLELKRRRGADASEVDRLEREALGPVRRSPHDSPDAILDPESAVSGAYPVEEEVPYPLEETPEWGGAGAEPMPFDPGSEPATEASPAANWSETEPATEIAPPPAVEYEPEPVPERTYDPPRHHEIAEEWAAHERQAFTGEPGGFEPDEPAPASPSADPGDAQPPPAASEGPVFGSERRPTPPASHDFEQETVEHDVEGQELGQPHKDEAHEGDDMLEETPDFLQDTPDHDRLWFEQRPPRDFDFDG
jgi:hypothetical protein